MLELHGDLTLVVKSVQTSTQVLGVCYEMKQSEGGGGDRWDCMQLFLELDDAGGSADTQKPEIIDSYVEDLFAEQLELPWDQLYEQDDRAVNWVITESSQNCTVSTDEPNLKPGVIVDFKKKTDNGDASTFVTCSEVKIHFVRNFETTSDSAGEDQNFTVDNPEQKYAARGLHMQFQDKNYVETVLDSLKIGREV